ncbi:MAG: hypothetical protein IT361_15355 [Gemmatimonadaceae bacterium]|nr:hypothetical protein [Gemmatimonadaceae bacterium]
MFALTFTTRRIRALVLTFVAPALGGACYRYQPTTTAELQAGQSVRVDLSAVAVDRVRRGPAEEARVVQGFNVVGKVSRVTGDSLVLSVEHSTFDAGARAITLNQDVRLLQSEVQRVQLRRLDRRRTTLASVAVGAALVAATAFAIQRGGRSTGGNPYNPSPPEIRIPLGLGWLMR